MFLGEIEKDPGPPLRERLLQKDSHPPRSTLVGGHIDVARRVSRATRRVLGISEPLVGWDRALCRALGRGTLTIAYGQSSNTNQR